MVFTANIDYKGLSEAFNKFPIVSARELRSEVKQSCTVIQVDARLHHDFKPKSGNLERSVNITVEQSGLSGKVFLDKGVASYGEYVHDGTKPHTIKPVKRKALYFVKGGQSYFSRSGVNHPGTKPDQFLYEAADRQEGFIMARLRGAVKRIIEMAGLN